MRISTYEIFLPLIDGRNKEIEGYTLLVNGLYGAMDVVKQEDAAKLQAGDFAGLPVALRERLLLRGHLTRKEAAGAKASHPATAPALARPCASAGELADLKLLSRVYKTIFARSSVNAVIMPTYDCNFRCPYCYEQHRLTKGQGWLASTMSDETMDAVFAALADCKKRGYALGGCTLYGGEPFLEKNLPVARKIAERCRALGMGIDAVTNGYDLASYIDFMAEYKVDSLQVTVDGPAEINDRRRRHKDGLPTYGRILDNVGLALAHGVSINLRVNVGRENLHAIPALIDDLKARGLIDREKFSYYFKATNNDEHPENNITEQDIVDELMKYGFTALEAIELQSQYSPIAEELTRLFRREAYPSFSPAYCGSQQGMIVIDPFGQVYACWDMVGKDGKIVGIADKAAGRFIWGFSKAKWRTRTVDLMKNCQLCPYIFSCRGGCASRAEYAYGDEFREYCGEAKEIFAFVVSRVAGKEWAEKHNDELTMSLAGPISRLTEKERETIMASTNQKEMFAIAKAAGLLPSENEAGEQKEAE